MGTKIELAACQRTILSEIADPEFVRRGIALTYAMSITSSEEVDWHVVNHAIVRRWSRSGLVWIKQRAWKLIAAKAAAVAKEKT